MPLKESNKQAQKLVEQETSEEKNIVKQTNNDDHQGVAETKITVFQDERENKKQTQEKRKQGLTNKEHTLGEAEQNKLKELKAIDQLKDSKLNESMEQKAEAEKEPKNKNHFKQCHRGADQANKPPRERGAKGKDRMAFYPPGKSSPWRNWKQHIHEREHKSDKVANRKSKRISSRNRWKNRRSPN
ncbi:hypothetical protein ACLKA6_012435 [Drosophila palustris]